MYAQYTLAQLTSEISNSLEDSANVQWAADEVHRAIREGLLHWGLLTSYWRERGSVATVAGAQFYDLTTYLPLLRAHAYTFDDIVYELQYHLLEPATGVAGAGMSAQFPIATLTSAVKRWRNRFVLDAMTPLVEGLFPTVPPPSGRAPLDQSVIAVQRASWKDTLSGIYTTLRREDVLTADAADYLWNFTPGTPFAYSTAETRPIEIQFVPPPSAPGRLHLLYVQSIDLAIAAGASLEVLDQMVHAVKYGVLYELLSQQGEAYDPLRAQYSLARYKQIVEAALAEKSVLRVQLNDKTLPLDTIWNLDGARPRWMNQLGTPNYCGVACDILAPSLVPDRVYGLTADLVRTAPLPALPADFIQVGREEIPYIFDYVRHVLSFKLGGAEFKDALPLLDGFLSGAMQRNKLLKYKSPYFSALFGQPEKQTELEKVA